MDTLEEPLNFVSLQCDTISLQILPWKDAKPEFGQSLKVSDKKEVPKRPKWTFVVFRSLNSCLKQFIQTTKNGFEMIVLMQQQLTLVTVELFISSSS